MKLTIVLYNNKKMIGKYLVDTISKTLDTFEREDDFLLNTEFTYERMVDFLKGRQIDFGRKNRKELLGYTYTAPDVWHEIAMTHGFDTDDFYWVSIPEINDEKFVLEDHHQTMDKRAAFNLNVIRKMCLYFLKVMTFPKKDLSYRRKQRYISVHLEDYLEQLFGERGQVDESFKKLPF